MKAIIKYFFLGMLILFFSLYFSKYTTDYYENKKTLTDEAIIRYEEDLKEGKEIHPEDYIKKEKNYNNKASKLGIETSKWIEFTFNKSIKLALKYLEKLENNE